MKDFFVTGSQSVGTEFIKSTLAKAIKLAKQENYTVAEHEVAEMYGAVLYALYTDAMQSEEVYYLQHLCYMTNRVIHKLKFNKYSR